ncbi:MAG: VOC family protein [Bacteroidota bacterium]
MRYLLSLLLITMMIHASAQSEFSNPTIQVGVVTQDLEKSKQFYTDVIGMTQTGGFEVTSDIAKSTGLTAGETLSVAVMKLEDSPSANEWKLMSFGKSGENAGHNYITEDVGMRYITIFYNSLNTVHERVKSNDIPMLGETPVKLPDGRHFILVQDPDGTFIELIGPMDE